MKEEYNKIPVCYKCGDTLDYITMLKTKQMLFYSTDGDYYKYENSYDKYLCKSCERNSKIDKILVKVKS